MPTIESKNVTTYGKIKYSGYLNKTVTAVSSIERLTRTGTGRRRKPQLPDQNGYTREQLLIRVPTGSGHYNSDKFKVNWSGKLATFGDYASCWKGGNTTFDSNLLDQANLKALSKFNRQDMDLGTAWVERGKTAVLVKDVATIGVQALQAIRRRSGRELLHVLGLNHHEARGRGVVDTYLAYHYGMKPLLQDVAGAVQALTRTSQSWRVQAKGTHTAEGEFTFKNKVYSYPWQGKSIYREHAKAILSATPIPITREQDIRWALGLDNPLTTAWEITPFSFVVDWMLPIGDWLRALNSLKYYSGWVSVLTQFRKDTAVYSGYSDSKAAIPYSSTVSGEGTSVRMNRRISGIPLFGLPIKDPISLDHMSKALSLLASMSANRGTLPPSIRY